ncbi:A/G-specific DNA-adenine glycosylase [Lachnospiraceae bacterium XBB1006]|nr:A/G-specific DNA-adenine glycosylase [Lachnospiraceae bacterium XBB1006]
MVTDFSFREIVTPLLVWFDENKRALPWREDRDAYHIWISEIMLQQTRVQAVIGYYERFMERLPNIKSLAECPEDELMKLWEGLGYYNRARNLQAAAKTVVETCDGKMPTTMVELLKLKGIGDYTARAIASQAFEEPVVAVDGNVLRVVTRLSNDDTDIMKQSFRRTVEQRLDAVVPTGRAGDFCQALMELGAIVCVPNAAPQCEQCPLIAYCRAKENDCCMQLPAKRVAKKRRIEERTVFILRTEDAVVLHKRPDSGLLAGLYEFPNALGYMSEKESLNAVCAMGFLPLRIRKMEGAKHIFSHVEWHMQGYEVWLDTTAKFPEGTVVANVWQMEEVYSIPAAFEGFKKQIHVVSNTAKKP